MMYRKKTGRIEQIFLLIAAGIFFLSGCNKQEVEPSGPVYELNDPEKRNNIILKVEESFYLNSDFQKYLMHISGEEYETLSLETLSRLLDDFVDEKILLEAARKSQISLTREEERSILSRLENASWPPENNKTQIFSMSGRLYEELVSEKYIVGLVSQFEVAEEEISEYYDLNKRDFLRSERIKVSQILVDSEDKAIEILDRTKYASEEVFRRLAVEYSMGVEAARGGEMGLFEMGQLPYEMEKVVFALREGEVSRVFESTYGYHIFRMDKKYEPELVSLEDASSEIRTNILDNKIKLFISNHLEELKSQMEWGFYPENLSFPYQRNENEHE